MPLMNTAGRATQIEKGAGQGKKARAVLGLPGVSYAPPIVAMLLASLALLVFFIILGLIMGGTSYTQIARSLNGERGVSPLLGAFCGLASLVSLAVVVFLSVTLSKAVRDLHTPMQYARGAVRDKRTIGGRNVGNWMTVNARYIGPDLETASALTDQERAAAPDRTQALQPRYDPPARTEAPKMPRRGSYLPAERVYASQYRASDASAESDDSSPRVVFRVDPASFTTLEPGEEALIAHSRYLQHIYYVAHLRGGEWESFKNKQLI